MLSPAHYPGFILKPMWIVIKPSSECPHLFVSAFPAGTLTVIIYGKNGVGDFNEGEKGKPKLSFHVTKKMDKNFLVKMFC